MRARVGKIARLPLELREELNRKLLENQPASKILPWLNGLAEMKAIIEEMGQAGGHQVGPCDDRNLSEWRRGGFADWLRRREAIEETRELAQWSVKLARAAGGNISEGASAILAGQLMEVLEGVGALKNDLETVDGAEDKAGKLEALAKVVDQVSKALANVRSGDHDRIRLDQNQQKLKQGAESLKLEREKFELKAAEMMLSEAVRRKAEEIGKSNLSNAEKIAAMRKAAFADVDALEASGEVQLPK